MRILQIVPSLGIDDGITNVLVKYLKALAKEEIIFDFLALNQIPQNKPSFKSEIEKLGGKTFYIGNPKNVIKFKRKWNYFCKNHYGEFVYLENNLIFIGGYFKNAKKELGVHKIITHVHNPVYGDSKFSNFRNSFLYKITNCPLGDILFSSSSESGIKLFGPRRNQKPWYVINNAFRVDVFKYDTSKREKIRRSMAWSNNYVVGHIGRFTPQKNHKFVIKSFYNFSKTCDNALLVLIGAGHGEDQAKRLVEKLGLKEKVQFLGVRTNINELLLGMDLFIFPSKFEGLGVAAVEAQISGVPCIISNCLPYEANITNCKVLGVGENDDIDRWCKAMRSLENSPRRLDGVKQAKEKGFDIKEEANKLKSIYCLNCLM